MKNIIFALTALLFIAAPAAAETARFDIEKPHTQIMFSVEHLGFSHSYGKFTDFDGHINFDQAAPEKSSVEVTIKTASINMDDQKWDDHLKNADFFNVEKFPVMTFKSTKVEKTGEKNAKVTGDLTLLGVTKPVALDVVFNKRGEHPYTKNDHIGFSAKGALKRSDFGMSYGIPGVGDDVALVIEVEGLGQPKTATPAAGNP